MLPPTINIFEKAAKKAGRLLIRDFGEVENLQIHSKTKESNPIKKISQRLEKESARHIW